MECPQCGEEVNPATAIQNTDAWNRGTGEFFCNDNCFSNASEANGLQRIADTYSN